MADSLNTESVVEASPSRRSFLRLAAMAGAVGLAGCAAPTPQVVEKQVEVTKEVEVTRPVEVTRQVEVTRPVEVVKTVEVTKEVAKAMPKVPWQYVRLDVETGRKYGHLGYYEGECCYGAFTGIVKQLVEQVGFPYTHVPSEMMKFGAGGVAGWGTTCGALIGAAAAITLVVDFEQAKKLIDELMLWYSQSKFPSEISNQYAANKQFLVKEYKSDKVLVQSVSNSPLCHVSVSKWCEASGFASGSKERAERCGRLAGDVAAHTIEILNAHLDGKFAVSLKPSAEAQVCTTCHTKGENFEMGNFTQGKGECLECHDPHPLKK